MEYTTQEYKGSEAYKSTVGATKEQLERRKPYTLLAVEYHKKNGNKEQEKFFLEDLKLIKELLS